MAKKSRTPAPPLPVQAPKRRTDTRDPRWRKRWLAAAAGAALVAVAAGGIAYAVSRGGGSDGAAAQRGDCRVQTFKSQGQDHVPPGTLPKGFKYNSYPPTSGPHNAEPLVWGEYTEPVPQDRLVHNLEHGGVAIQYGEDVSDDTVAELTDWFRTDPRGMVLAPLSAETVWSIPDYERAATATVPANLADTIVLAAWVATRDNPNDPNSRILKLEGKLATCSRFDEEAFNDFVDEYRAQGPEAFPLESLQPGSQ